MAETKLRKSSSKEWALDCAKDDVNTRDIRPRTWGVEDALEPGYMTDQGDTLIAPNFGARKWKTGDHANREEND